MLNLSDVKNILFDLGGVIINIDQAKVFNTLVENGITKDQIESDKNVFTIYEKGEISSSDFIHAIQEKLPQLTKHKIIAIWNSMLLDIPKERITLLKNLSKNYSLYLLSNTNELHMKHIQNYVSTKYFIPSIDELFLKTYYSYKLGMRKPNKNIFLHVLNENKLVPEETLFIDDSIEHIESAKKLNIKTHWLDISNDETITKLFK